MPSRRSLTIISDRYHRGDARQGAHLPNMATHTLTFLIWQLAGSVHDDRPRCNGYDGRGGRRYMGRDATCC